MRLENTLLPNPLTSSNYDYSLESDSTYFLTDEGSGRLEKDLWGFDWFWWQVSLAFSSIDQLYGAISDLQNHIEYTKEKYRPLVAEFPDLKTEENKDRGVSGSYFLIDETGQRRYIIKPFDEDAGCIHSDGFASPFLNSPFRGSMPLYLSSMREVLAYKVAQCIGAYSTVPKTELGIFHSDQFHDFVEGIDPKEVTNYLDHCELADKEKLCSAQEYVQNAKNLFEALQDFQMADLTDDEIAARFDTHDFEEANILIWTTFDTDAHAGNILVYPKGVDAIGNEILGLKKIDNGLAFPDMNVDLRNSLAFLPNAKVALSNEAKEKIALIDENLLATHFEQMGLASAVGAMKKRIAFLKELVKEDGITIKQINRAMSELELNS